MADNLKYIIESLLFVSDAALTVDQLKNVLDGVEAPAIRAAIEELMAEYDQREGGFALRAVAGGFQFRTRRRYNEWIRRLVRPAAQRLSKAALETLAIIAYNQPIIRSDIEHIRGVDSGGVIRMLMERKLIRVLGRKEIPGRPLIYATTKHFLEVFELKNLKDLPTPKEIEELSQSHMDAAADSDDDDAPDTDTGPDTTAPVDRPPATPADDARTDDPSPD